MHDMRWLLVLAVVVVVVAAATAGPRRCAPRLARERLKAAEKVRARRPLPPCCAPPCAPRRRPPSTAKYQPFHKTWYGLKHAYKKAARLTPHRANVGPEQCALGNSISLGNTSGNGSISVGMLGLITPSRWGIMSAEWGRHRGYRS
ncbi:uncharacterized protein LOC121733349 [Aricia agestis]|uniref:uncharacterized protein LOC121733349 n=1 Tax=Aricia agestis TaxID=91739 RepID=UPI001C205CF7|nr:uncharacterized protein LOC121733349 [Aricia agestis]